MLFLWKKDKSEDHLTVELRTKTALRRHDKPVVVADVTFWLPCRAGGMVPEPELAVPCFSAAADGSMFLPFDGRAA